MAIITITIPDDQAREIEEWAQTHSRMLISTTVPALRHWTFNSQAMNVQYTMGRSGLVQTD